MPKLGADGAASLWAALAEPKSTIRGVAKAHGITHRTLYKTLRRHGYMPPVTK